LAALLLVGVATIAGFLAAWLPVLAGGPGQRWING
jgi:hypothetical protein